MMPEFSAKLPDAARQPCKRTGYFVASIKTAYVMYSFLMLVACVLNLFPDYHSASYALMLTYICIVALTLRYRNFSIYQIFLATFFLFLLSRIFLSALGLFDFTRFRLMRSRTVAIGDDVALEMVCTLHVFLIGTSYAWLQSLKQDSKAYAFFRSPAKISKGVQQALSLAFYVFAIVMACRYAFKIWFVFRHGYLSIYTGEFRENEPLFFRGSATILNLLYILLVFYNRSNVALFKRYTLAMLAIYTASLLTGQRGPGMIFMFYAMYMWSTFYKEIRVFSFKVVAGFLALAIMIIGIGTFRSSYSLDALSRMFNGNLLVRLLSGQGVSLEVVGDVIMYKDSFLNRMPFIIGYFVDLFSSTPPGQNIENITRGNYLGHHLSYRLNPSGFFAGHGTGTSIVAETYELCDGSLALIFLFAFLMTKAVLLVARYSFKSPYMLAVSYYVLRNFIYSPRDSVFKNLGGMALMLAGVFAFSLFNSLLAIRQKEGHGAGEGEAARAGGA